MAKKIFYKRAEVVAKNMTPQADIFSSGGRSPAKENILLEPTGVAGSPSKETTRWLSGEIEILVTKEVLRQVTIDIGRLIQKPYASIRS
jgi:hypothetical protein